MTSNHNIGKHNKYKIYPINDMTQSWEIFKTLILQFTLKMVTFLSSTYQLHEFKFIL